MHGGPISQQTIDVASLRPLFAPRSVAIVGASNDPKRIGGRPIQYALAAGFRGRIHPVNPTRGEVQGLKAYPDVTSIPDEVDLVVVAVPSPLVRSTLEAAAARGTKAAIVFSAGFAEVGDDAAVEQSRLAERVRALGMRVLGPNCVGLYNSMLGHTPTFASFLQEPVAPGGRVALATQSGAFGSYMFMLGRSRGIRIGQWIATGNEMDIGVADAIAYYAEDPSVSVIGCMMEGVRDGRRFLEALARAHAARKPVLLLKCGRTDEGIAAARWHTAATPVDDDVFDAAVRQAGALRVSTMEDMLDALYGLQLRPPLGGNKLGIVSISGGAGVLMADAAVAHGFTLPPMPIAAQRRLKAANPLATMANPIDVTAQALNDASLVSGPVRAMLSEGGYDAVAGFFMNYLSSPVNGAQMRAALDDAIQGFPDRTIAIASSASADVVRAFEERGFLMFEDPVRAVATLAAMSRVGEALRHPAAERASTCGMPLLDGSEGDAVRARSFLAQAGIPVHGGPTGAAPERAAAEASDDPLRVALSAWQDPTFGTVVAMGLVRGAREPARAAATRVGALTRPEAGAMIGELLRGIDEGGAAGAPTADAGARRLPLGPSVPTADARSDLDALAAVLVRFSALAVANEGRFARIDVAPLLVRAPGHGCLAVDVRVTSRSAG